MPKPASRKYTLGEGAIFPNSKEGQSKEGPPLNPMRTLSRYLLAFLIILVITQLSRHSSTPTGAPQTAVVYPDLYEASVAELQQGLSTGHFTSVDLVNAYFARIEEVNIKGPGLRAVLELNPSALALAAQLDEERSKKGPRSVLHGIPVLVKDNIATAAWEGMNTTAGSYALLGSNVPRDATVVARLRKAGAIILGKANLSEWSHFRGRIASGWSARGGQATSPYYPGSDPCGSSSGSAVAAAIGLAPVTLGTETDGSITCPAAQNNVVGIKPTVGLTSRAGVIPISQNQDTVGPIVRDLADAAIVLSIIAGKDSRDDFTLAQPTPVPDFTKALKKDALRGKRVGVPRWVFVDSPDAQPDLKAAFEEALATLKSLGATVVDPADLDDAEEFPLSKNDTIVLETDFKQGISTYLSELTDVPSGVKTLADLIQFNIDHADLELPAGYEDQSEFLNAEATTGYNAKYYEALQADYDLGRTRGIDATIKKHRLDALVSPAFGWSTSPAAVAGYPIITVPLGFFSDNATIEHPYPQTVYPAPGAPFALSFWGTAYSESPLIGMAYAFEQKTQARKRRRAYPEAIPKTQLRDVIGYTVS